METLAVLRLLFSISCSTSNRPVPGVGRMVQCTEPSRHSARPSQKLSTRNFTSRVNMPSRPSGYGERTVMRTSLPTCSRKARLLYSSLQHQPALPVDAGVVIGATERIFMQADDQLVEQSFRAGGLTVACVHDVTDLRLLDVARRGRGFPTRSEIFWGGYRGRVDR